MEEGSTKHLQCYVYLKNAITRKALSKKIPRAFLEEQKGTNHQAASYCKKEGNYVEYGEIPKKGARNDLKDLKDDIKNGMKMIDIVEKYPAQSLRYMNNITKMISIFNDNKAKNTPFRKVTVHVLFGETGCGKTSSVFKDCSPEIPYQLLKSSGSTIWWEHYQNDKIILIDDFYSWISWNEILRILDGYPLALNVKHSSAHAFYDTVYITSNSEPNDWYPNIVDKSALFRRINYIYHFKNKLGEPIDIKCSYSSS